MFNIFFLVFFFVAVGIILSIFITRQKEDQSTVTLLLEEDASSFSSDKEISLEHLHKLVEKWCEENKLFLKQKMEDTWIFESQNTVFEGQYIFHFIETTSTHPLVGLTDIFEFKDFVKSMGNSKGFILTTGFFSKQVHQPLEGPKIQLFNKKKIIEALEKYTVL